MKAFYNLPHEFKVFVKQENSSLVCRIKNSKTIKRLFCPTEKINEKDEIARTFSLS